MAFLMARVLSAFAWAGAYPLAFQALSLPFHDVRLTELAEHVFYFWVYSYSIVQQRCNDFKYHSRSLLYSLFVTRGYTSVLLPPSEPTSLSLATIVLFTKPSLRPCPGPAG
jgi:hypothetical protein